MSEIDEILSQVPMDQVAAALGVDQSEAEEATRTAIPALLGGMQANAADPAGAASLMSAVEQHDPSVLGSGLDQIDTQDGEQDRPERLRRSRRPTSWPAWAEPHRARGPA